MKPGRDFPQPLSDLAVEIAREAMGESAWLFEGRFGDGPLGEKAMADRLRGTKYGKGKRKGEIKTPGICQLLGIKPFTPHDLRRTAARILSDAKVPSSLISLCLSHRVREDEHGAIARVTREHYDDNERVEEKREVLQILADEIRRITSAPVAVEAELQQAA